MRKPSLASQGCSVLSITTLVVGISRSRSCEVGTWDLLSWSAYGSASRSGCKTATLGVAERKLNPRENSLPPNNVSLQSMDIPGRTMWRTGGFPDPPHRPERAQIFVLPVVCFRRACPFLMAWSTFFFLFTISSFKAWRERQLGLPFCGQVPESRQPEILRSPRTAPTEHEKGGQQI